MNFVLSLRTGMASLLLALAAHGGSAGVESDLDARLKAAPKDAAGLFTLGQDLRRAGRFDAAVQTLRRAYFKTTKGEQAVAVRLEAARALIDAGKQKLALRECASLKSVSMPMLWVCTAEAQLLWRRASLALPLADKALEAEADNYDARVARGRALEQMGKAAEADQEYRRAAAAQPKRYEAHLYRGQMLLQGSKREGIAALRTARQSAPQEPVPLLALGTALGGTEAQKLLEQAIALRPTFGAAHARLGVVKHGLGDLAGAEQALLRALALDAKQADWLAALAAVLVDKGDAAGAIARADAALKLVGNHAAAKLARADALAQRGDIDLAIEAYEQAHGYARTDPAPLLHAARACAKNGRPTTARAFAERATQDFPKWAPAWVVLADVQHASGDRAAAKQSYKKALGAQSGTIDRARVARILKSLR
ncbi:MAG: tetratricopeptide repeat protein [Polyangiaceae bacterium]